MDKTAYTDSQLIAMIRSGDNTARQAALKRIYFSGFGPAKGRILKHGGRSQDVDDAAQEAIIILDNNIRNFQYEQKASLKNYFAGICYWQWRSMRDKTKRIDWAGEIAPFEGEVTQTPEVVMLDEELKKEVRELLEKEELGEDCREVLKLFRLSYSRKEIARAFGYSEGYAKLKVFRCMEKLRNILENNPGLRDKLQGLL